MYVIKRQRARDLQLGLVMYLLTDPQMRVQQPAQPPPVSQTVRATVWHATKLMVAYLLRSLANRLDPT